MHGVRSAVVPRLEMHERDAFSSQQRETDRQNEKDQIICCDSAAILFFYGAV